MKGITTHVEKSDGAYSQGNYGLVVSHHHEDRDGNPLGGDATGVGFAISWQHGPRGQDDAGIALPATGAAVEDVARALESRLAFLQAGPYPCDENSEAHIACRNMIKALERRRENRRARGVECVNAK